MNESSISISESLKREMKLRLLECNNAQEALSNAINVAIEAEINYLQTSIKIMHSQNDPRRLSREYGNRLRFLQMKSTSSYASKVARKIVNASRLRRLLDIYP